MKQGRVLVEPNASKDWPHGRIKIVDGETSMRLTPNQARRLIGYLQVAIVRAEEK